MIVTTAQLYKVAYGKFAIGAYNINNMEQCLGLFRGNVQSKVPFTSSSFRKARENMPTNECIASGFYSSVMLDASHEPFEKNVAITKRIVDKAHAKGIRVEAE